MNGGGGREVGDEVRKGGRRRGGNEGEMNGGGGREVGDEVRTLMRG